MMRYRHLILIVALVGCGSADTTGLFGDEASSSTSGAGGTTSTSTQTATVTSSTTGSACQAQTCLDQSKNCGVIDNGCGHKEDCGNCTGEYQVCGDDAPDASGMPVMGKDNVCGGGCTTSTVHGCDGNQNKALIYCSGLGSTPPFPTGCIIPGGSPPPTSIWCCNLNN